uniref:Uncharacterized protein n=1 Tax=Salix viminalis TaxID=40686 RepID=A0A6N2MLP8_SALVM
MYHSSQPWPGSMRCQLMVGFLAYAKSLEIKVDKAELEEQQRPRWTGCAEGLDRMCRGVEKGQSLSSDFKVESGELSLMFLPGPFAIAHHLITSWVNQGSTFDAVHLKQQPNSFQSNLYQS